MRRDNIMVLQCWIAVVLVSLISAACADRGTELEYADLVLRHGRIVTVADGQSEFGALAIKGPQIMALGTVEEVDVLIGPATRVIDLAGRLAVPGFIEGHGHFLSLGNALTVLDLTRSESWEEIVAMVGKAAAAAAPGTWVLGRGWHQEKWSSPPEPAVEGSPVHHSLSAASPDNPVLLGHASGHAAFANQQALETAGLTRNSDAPAGGEHGGDMPQLTRVYAL